MHWRELVEESARRAGKSPEEMEAALDAFFDAVIAEIGRSDAVELRKDFGGFVVREHGGEKVSQYRDNYTKVQRTVFFKASNDLKKRMRQSDEDFMRMLEDKGAAKQLGLLRKAQAAAG